MHLGVPVLARNIPGNSAVIQHKETGLLFDSPEVCKMVCDNDPLNLKQNAKKKDFQEIYGPKFHWHFGDERKFHVAFLVVGKSI